MSAAGLVDVGAQPDGGLSGKITYIMGGHGYTTFHDSSSVPDFWSFQRGNTHGMVEDLGNQEQMTALADYLFRAGATVVPMRPIGYQPLEIILDNDSAGVTFSGAWSNSTSPIYFAGTTGGSGGPADAVPYRFATTAATETAYARYRPTVTTAGFYPVYCWTRPGTDRATDQLYRVAHSGGITEVTINHREVGNGLIYLGTYHFEAGTEGYVDISNRSNSPGSVVIADMIRFGNGMGDLDRGLGISGRTREDEPALYWLMWHVARSRGISTTEFSSGSVDEDATVAASPKWAEFMNQGTAAGLPNRILISFHSNASNGSARGVTVLHNTNSGGATPNQLFLAQTLGTEIQADMLAQNGQYEHNWNNRGSSITYQAAFNYGELNNAYINGEFDATIVEVAFHDNVQDAQLMRDPKVRDALARGTYQGMVKYFRGVDGNTTPLTMLPGKVTQVRSETVGPGSVKVTWTAPAANSYNGDAATGYRIYGSTNGYGFDGGTYVAGGGTLTYTFNGLDANEGAYYFKVVAVNEGGEGAGSEVVAAIPAATAQKVLIVNGFDQLNRTQNPTQTYGGTMDRVRPRFSNSFDYAAQMAAAIEAYGSAMVVDTTSNEFVASGAVNLNGYSAVFWILGEESTSTDTFDAAEQAKVTAFLAAGGKLFLSGSEIGWDLDSQAGGASFYNNQLRADFVADDAASYSASAVAGSIFTGLPAVQFDNGAQFYNVDFPDRISPLGGATAALNYSSGGAAGIQYADAVSGSKVVMLAFPFETITAAATRNALMARVLDFFQTGDGVTEVELVLDNDDGAAVYAETGSWTLASAPGYNGLTYRFASAGDAATAKWQFYAPFDGHGEVFVQFRSGSNRTENTAYSIDTGAGVETASANQLLNGLTWASLGTFDFTAGLRSVTLDVQNSTGGSIVVADAVRIVLSNAPEPTGDFDGDGLVDGADFLAWQRGVGVPTPELADGDADASGEVDGDDLGIWSDQYGSSGASAATTAAMLADAAVDGNAHDAMASGDLYALGQRVGSALLPAGAAKEPVRARNPRGASNGQTPSVGIAADDSVSVPDAVGGAVDLATTSAIDAESAQAFDAVDDAFGQLLGSAWEIGQ